MNNATRRIVTLRNQILPQEENFFMIRSEPCASRAPMNEQFKIRRLELGDYYKGFLELLSQLTTVGKITQEEFKQRFFELHKDTYFIMVIEDVSKSKIVSTATLVIEKKFVHQNGKVGHIEDVVVDKDYRGKNFGKIIIEELIRIAEEQGCYKTILDCSEKNVPFYEKCGFKRKEIQMRYDHKH